MEKHKNPHTCPYASIRISTINTTSNVLVMIHNYIAYYNNRRVQRNLGVLTPAEKHEQYFMAA